VFKFNLSLGGVKAAEKITVFFAFLYKKQEYKSNYTVNGGIQSASLIFVLLLSHKRHFKSVACCSIYSLYVELFYIVHFTWNYITFTKEQNQLVAQYCATSWFCSFVILCGTFLQ
jgi:hypothetical protein